MRQQRPSAEHAPESFFMPTAANGTHQEDMTKRRGDATQGTSTVSATLVHLAALTRLLVVAAPTDDTLLRAIEIALRLLPQADALRLLALESTSSRAVRWEGNITRGDEANSSATSTMPGKGIGLSADVEERVLTQRQTARVGTMQVIPLVARSRDLLGVLVIYERRQHRRATDARLLASVTDHLTLLLDHARLEDAVEAEGHARDAFISLAAHELRSPLTSLKGYAQLLARQSRKTPLSDSMQRSVEAIEQQSVRMAEMVGELLDGSRIQRGNLDLLPGYTELVKVAKKALERRQAIYPQHQFILDVVESGLVVNGDQLRVEQILRDLLDNAGRYSSENGVITLRIMREGDMALVSVHDQGIGISAADQPRIFDYLYRAPSTEQRNLSGLGLGLFISRYLVEHLGGRLWLAASSDAAPTGSDFRFTLPLAQS